MSDTLQRDSPETEELKAAAEATSRKAWWLVTRRRRTEWQTLTATGLASFTGRPRAHYEAVRPGDPVFLYVSKPDHAILAVGVVTEGIKARVQEEQAGEAAPGREVEPQIEVQMAFEVPSALSWRDILAVPALAGAEPVKQRSSGTLFALTDDEYKALQALIIVRNPELAGAFASVDSGAILSTPEPDESHTPRAGFVPGAVREDNEEYLPAAPGFRALRPIRSLAELQSLTGLPCEMLEEARDLLEDTGQIVLSGPPGTGKTWLARGLTTYVAGDPARVQVVQFHPATTYEDFIEGLKPKVDAWGHVTYAIVPGLFVRLCREARYDPNHHYVLVIDEINRAPLARVFGELLYALEYRGPQGAVELSVSAGMEQAEQSFFVPENVLIIATMNSADRSLALVDYALRRRFRFVELEPNAQVLDAWLARHQAGTHARRVVLDLFERVNNRLTESLDPDHRLGHSYFMLDPLNAATLDRLWRTAIKPLIAEYFIPPAGELEEYQHLFTKAVRALSAEC
jgi:hypothetical protein